jgi:hypothetical protein
MWKNVVNSINLSEKQKHDVVSWKQMFMQKVEPIVEERKKLNIQIQAHLPQVRPARRGAHEPCSVSPPGTPRLNGAPPFEAARRGGALRGRECPCPVPRGRRGETGCGDEPFALLARADWPSNLQPPLPPPQESFHTRNAITYIKTHEAVAKLRENLKAEHNVTIEFCAAVFKGVLNHFQMASLLVQAYPAVPDALAVASAVIADMADKGEALPDKVGAARGTRRGGGGGWLSHRAPPSRASVLRNACGVRVGCGAELHAPTGRQRLSPSPAILFLTLTTQH